LCSQLRPPAFFSKIDQIVSQPIKIYEIFQILQNFPTLYSRKFLLFLHETLHIRETRRNKVCLKFLESYVTGFNFYSHFCVNFFVKLVNKNPGKIRKPWKLAQTNLSGPVVTFYYAFRVSIGIDAFPAKRIYD
jgi:hypothetical protein